MSDNNFSFDFDPIFDNAEQSEVSSEVTPIEQPENKSAIVPYVVNEDILSIINLLGITESHVVDDASCRDEISKVLSILGTNKDKMSIKELLEYLKTLRQERQYHADCLYKSYNYILKTELAKRLLLGSNKDKQAVDVKERQRLKGLVEMLKENIDQE